MVQRTEVVKAAEAGPPDRRERPRPRPAACATRPRTSATRSWPASRSCSSASRRWSPPAGPSSRARRAEGSPPAAERRPVNGHPTASGRRPPAATATRSGRASSTRTGCSRTPRSRSLGSVTSSFLVPTGELLRRPGTRQHVVLAGPVRRPRAVDDAARRRRGRGRPRARGAGDAVMLTGTVSGRWDGECRRCLEDDRRRGGRRGPRGLRARPGRGRDLPARPRRPRPRADGPRGAAPWRCRWPRCAATDCPGPAPERPPGPGDRGRRAGRRPPLGGPRRPAVRRDASPAGRAFDAARPQGRYVCARFARRSPTRPLPRIRGPMAVPKKKTSKSKSRSRRASAWTPRPPRPAASAPAAAPPSVPHVVCGNCGWYHGRQAIDVD